MNRICNIKKNKELRKESEKLRDFIERYEPGFKNEEIKEVVVGDRKVIFE